MTQIETDIDAECEILATKIAPLLKDAIMRSQLLSFDYDKALAHKALYTLTEKMPDAIFGMKEIPKDTRKEILGMIDFLDRGIRGKDDSYAIIGVLTALTVMLDLFGQAAKFMNLKVMDDGVDVTDDVFGRAL